MKKKHAPILRNKPDWNWEPSLKILRWGFTLCVFVILLVTILIFSGVEILLERTRIVDITYGRLVIVLICAFASVTLGSFITAVSIQLPMLPVKTICRLPLLRKEFHIELAVSRNAGISV